jgi:predicted Zn-dependent peptidase
MYQKTVLDNGLTVLTEHTPEFRSVSLGVWVSAGSRFETVKQAGITHFIEHLLFKGTQKRSAYDIAVTMDNIGGRSTPSLRKNTLATTLA